MTPDLNGKIFIGVVEDTNDPRKIGRVKVRVTNIFDDIPVGDIPWASPYKNCDGEMFTPPSKNKVVSVVFDQNNIYMPFYIFSEHYNINLEKKLAGLSDADYSTFKSLMFDEKTQIYCNDTEGLMIDYKFNNINIKKDTLTLNLKDNFSHLNIGNDSSNQSAVLGDSWMTFVDGLVSNLLRGPYLGNMGAPVVADPSFIDYLNSYQAKRQTFLSKHVSIVDNDQVSKKDRIAIPQVGDNYTTTIQTIPVAYSTVDFAPQSGITPQVDNPNYVAESTDQNIANSPQKNNLVPSSAGLPSNSELLSIIDAMNRKGYKIYDTALRPNIVGIRTKTTNPIVTNQFDEKMYLFLKNDLGEWIMKKYVITTVPGLAIGSTVLPNRVAVLAAAQYIDYFMIRVHGPGGYLAVCARKTGFTVHRQSATATYTFGAITNDGSGINLHKSGSPLGHAIYNWSEGCQVFKYESEFNEFMAYCTAYRDASKNNVFTYTLMNDSDIIPSTTSPYTV
jgi:hypothetical protein